MSAWTEHVEKWKDCTACALCKQRFRICLARGTVPCDVLFVGEAPGASEDALGQPFVGAAGSLLDQIIERALPGDIAHAMTNLVCCFPKEAKENGDHQPQSDEIRACKPRLIEFVNICQPRLIICVGRLSSANVDHDDTVRCISIDHPAYILRMPLAKKQFEIQKCIAQIRTATMKMMEKTDWVFQQWGKKYGNKSSTRVGRSRTDPRVDYDSILGEIHQRVESGNDDDIPF